MRRFDLCVIGGGAAGLTCAAGAAQLGAKVALVERRIMGGECLNFGCVPSKALLHAASIAHSVATAGTVGIGARLDPVHLPNVLARVHDVIAKIAPNDSLERFRSLGVSVFEDDARFSNAHEIVLAKGERIRARRFVIATGTRPFVPPIPGLADVPYLTNETVFDLAEPVPHLLILGGGPVGIELAQAFVRLGSQVSLVEGADRLLAQDDPELSEGVTALLQQAGVTVCTGWEAVRVECVSGGVVLGVRNRLGVTEQLEGTHLLVAAGRRPALDLDLDKAGVALRDGRLVVDDRLRTTRRHIFACGDVAGPPYFTHMAEHRAGVVLRNALFHMRARVEQNVVPWVLFTDPELARVGLSETAAQAQGLRHVVYRVPLARADRAETDGAPPGFIKLVARPNGRLLGATILAPRAGELIHEYALALRLGLKLGAVSGLIHAYPAYAQLNRFAADERVKQALTPARRRWIRRVFRLHGVQQ